MSPRQKWFGGLCALTVLCIWSSFILIARSSAEHTLTAFDIAFLRFLFSGVAVLPLIVWRVAKAVPGAPWLGTALGGLSAPNAAAIGAVAGIGYCTLAYSGFFFAPVAHAAVLLPGSLPLWTALIAAVLLHERISPLRAMGLSLIVAGDLLVGGASLLKAFDGGEVWKGDLLFLAAACTWGTYTVLCRKWCVGAIDATLAIALFCLISFVPLYALGAWSGWWPSRLAQAGWSELAFQAVYQGGFAMLVAGFAFTHVVTIFGPLRTVMITAMVPVISALAAVPLLGEPLSPLPLAGLVCVTLGLLVGLRTVSAPARAPVEVKPA